MLTAAAANAAWAASAWPAYRAFRRALDNPAAAQRAWLARHLRQSAGTAFAREHGLAAGADLAEFRRRVPVRDYDALRPWVDRVRRGEANVLTAGPVERLMTSSGSTAAAKFLPQTRQLRREFAAAIGPWVIDLFRQFPRAAAGRAYWSVTPSTPPPRVESAVPIGFDDDAAYLGGAAAWLAARVMAVPPGVARIADGDAFFGATARGLLACRDLALISVWHPSFLTLLLGHVARARGGVPADWREVWPRLRLVSAWADAAAAGPAADLRAALPGVAFQAKGLLATEGCVTIPFAGRHLVAVRSHLFEFESADGAALAADELEPGGEYGVILTAGGGLWRHRLGDCVRVDGFVGRTPSLRLVGRADRVVDQFGEKLADGFVAGVLARLVPGRPFAMLAPGEGRYALYVEGKVDQNLADRLDAALRANPHYDHCRNLRQLAPAIVVPVRTGAYARYVDRLRGEGMRLGDIKPAALDGRAVWAEWLA